MYLRGYSDESILVCVCTYIYTYIHTLEYVYILNIYMCVNCVCKLFITDFFKHTPKWNSIMNPYLVSTTVMFFKL